MDEIRDVVNSVVRGCSKVGVEVPDVLAAFIARTVRFTITITRIVVEHDPRIDIVIFGIRLLNQTRHLSHWILALPKKR